MKTIVYKSLEEFKEAITKLKEEPKPPRMIMYDEVGQWPSEDFLQNLPTINNELST
jgi:hypothetical protein